MSAGAPGVEFDAAPGCAVGSSTCVLWMGVGGDGWQVSVAGTVRRHDVEVIASILTALRDVREITVDISAAGFDDRDTAVRLAAALDSLVAAGVTVRHVVTLLS